MKKHLHKYTVSPYGTVGFEILAGGPITSVAMNPPQVFGRVNMNGRFHKSMDILHRTYTWRIIAGLLYFNYFLEAKKK